MTAFYVERSYPPGLPRNASSRVSSISRHDALFPRSIYEPPCSPFIFTFRPSIPRLGKVIVDVTFHLADSKVISEALALTYRLQPNLRSHLVRSNRSTKSPTLLPGTTPAMPCGAPKCLKCKQIRPPSHLLMRIPGNHTCKSNLIYNISCTLSPTLYIGKTDRRLHEHFREHHRIVTLESVGEPKHDFSTMRITIFLLHESFQTQQASIRH